MPFGPDDIKGRGIERAAEYLTKSGVSNVKQDATWPTLIDLRDLRNLITHRAGAVREEYQQKLNGLLQKYEGDLEAEKTPMGLRNEMWISMELCRRFTTDVEAFLGRVVSDVNALPHGDAIGRVQQEVE